MKVSTCKPIETIQDVVVVGGGPCGSFTAFNLAKKGVKVTVFEEHQEIGVPSHCAGHLSMANLKRLGLYPLPNNIVENIFYGAKFYAPNGVEFAVRFDSPVTCTVNRALFDKHIAQMAEKVGVCYRLKSQVSSLTIKAGKVNGVTVREGGKTFNVDAKIVVDAEGVTSKIIKKAGLFSTRKRKIVNGFQAEIEKVENVKTDYVEVFLGNEYAPGFYAWLIPKNDGKAKVGLAVEQGNPREFFRKLMYKHPAASLKLRNANIIRESFHPITLSGPIPKVYSNGFLAVGDVASQVKPTTGGGVILGLNCAKIAADVVFEALKNDNFSSKFLSSYQKRCAKLLGFDVKAMLIIRKMLDEISDKKFNDIICFYRRIKLDKSLKNFNEIDFQGQAILKAGKNPKILIATTYFFATYLMDKLLNCSC